ncbi:MAG: hypothetical protein HY537_16115 [Deltaproteobacteria bacterium]|nr:hypothetical protein [Deltaproteobacteria bacterium]
MQSTVAMIQVVFCIVTAAYADQNPKGIASEAGSVRKPHHSTTAPANHPRRSIKEDELHASIEANPRWKALKALQGLSMNTWHSKSSADRFLGRLAAEYTVPIRDFFEVVQPAGKGEYIIQFVPKPATSNEPAYSDPVLKVLREIQSLSMNTWHSKSSADRFLDRLVADYKVPIKEIFEVVQIPGQQEHIIQFKPPSQSE